MTDITKTLLETAVKHHQQGNLQQAELIYHEVLQNEPDNPTALHSLGTIAYLAGKYEQAAELLNKAIEKNRQIPQLHNQFHQHLHLLRDLSVQTEKRRR